MYYIAPEPEYVYDSALQAANMEVKPTETDTTTTRMSQAMHYTNSIPADFRFYFCIISQPIT